jgi:prevent-host-death family protein
MDETPRIVPVTDLRRQASRLIHEAFKSERPVFITQHGYITAVLLSSERYEDLRCDAERKSAPLPRILRREEPYGHRAYGPDDYETARLLSADGYATELDDVPPEWLDPGRGRRKDAG